MLEQYDNENRDGGDDVDGDDADGDGADEVLEVRMEWTQAWYRCCVLLTRSTLPVDRGRTPYCDYILSGQLKRPNVSTEYTVSKSCKSRGLETKHTHYTH